MSSTCSPDSSSSSRNSWNSSQISGGGVHQCENDDDDDFFDDCRSQFSIQPLSSSSSSSSTSNRSAAKTLLALFFPQKPQHHHEDNGDNNLSLGLFSDWLTLTWQSMPNGRRERKTFHSSTSFYLFLSVSYSVWLRHPQLVFFFFKMIIIQLVLLVVDRLDGANSWLQWALSIPFCYISNLSKKLAFSFQNGNRSIMDGRVRWYDGTSEFETLVRW